jgi:hypothetical protein
MKSKRHDYLTIVAIYGHNDGATAIPALVQSMRELPGARGLLISIKKPPGLPPEIEWTPIVGMDYRQYSLFVMYCLTHFIKTDYVLTVQDDGWVLNGENWRDEYLNYDYVGAPCHVAIVDGEVRLQFDWVLLPNARVVQNGGFSLRSRKYLLAPGLHGVMYHFQEEKPIPYEDFQLAGLYRPQMESLGIRYAPDEIAKNFAVEYFGPVFHDNTRFEDLFGLHGQTRRLRDNKVVDYGITYDVASTIYREVAFMDYLDSIGYSVEYAAA